MRLQTGHPAPAQKTQPMITSALGSVYGKKLGRNRTRALGENISRAKVVSVPLSAASEIPSPTASPSIWVNIGVCVRSRSSRR